MQSFEMIMEVFA